MAKTIDITDKAGAGVRELRAAIGGGRLANAMGRGATNRIRAHFTDLNAARPNQLGGRRTNFWAAAARSTNYTASPEQVLININQLGFRQRLQGGVIRPVKAKYLTIPAAPEAHGRRAREFSNLRFGFAENKFGNLQPALIEASATAVTFGRRRKDGTRAVKRGRSLGGRTIFFLTRQVFQRADPTVLPPDQEIIEAALQGGREAFAAITQRAQKGGGNA